MIDIADNDTGGVRRRERDGGIGGDPDEEAPVAAGQVARPVARAVDFVDVERLAGPVRPSLPRSSARGQAAWIASVPGPALTIASSLAAASPTSGWR